MTLGMPYQALLSLVQVELQWLPLLLGGGVVRLDTSGAHSGIHAFRPALSLLSPTII